MTPHVSIIIPAHNAAETLGETLESLLAQTYPHWEAIVIENGSRDETAAVAEGWTQRDPRIRVTRSDPGVSVARNAGLRLAAHPWILFLDADDWILPTHLERLMAEFAANQELDAAHCGWRRIGPDGATLVEDFGPTETDLFHRFARTCAITIHSCITRRALIDAAGGFDPSLKTCEDWDLWQRLARVGCRFGAVRETLACYRVRPSSASMNAAQLVADSRLVIARGNDVDPRVKSPHPSHANGAGASAAELQTIVLYTIAWAAGLAIGGGAEAASLLDLAEVSPGASLDPSGVAGCIHCCALLPQALPTSAWADKFESLAPRLLRFLDALEAKTNQVGLARAAYTHLARRALEDAARPRPFTVGTLHAARIEVTDPIPDLEMPASVERVHCRLFVEGKPLGTLELPVFDGSLPAAVLTDAIAAEFAWPILQRFFEKQLYPQFTTWRKDDGWHVRRGELQLGSALPGNGKISWAEVHDQIGWTVFLQEAWGDSTRLAKQFYASQPDRAAPAASVDGAAPDWLVVEISDPSSGRSQPRPRVGAVLTVGGAVVVSTRSVAGPGTISAVALQAALTTEAGFELCCACVREAVIGRRFDEPVPLRARLAERAGQHPLPSPPADTALLPRRAGPCGSSASRRATLPRAVLPEIRRLYAQPGRAPLPFSTKNTAPSRVLYLPDRATELDAPANAHTPSKTSNYDGAFFEDLFHQNSNPWHYDTPYEQTKYDQTLALLPPRRFGRALELACAEGHFTQRLAPRVDALLATDISPTALQRASSRCREHANIRFKPLDLAADPLPGLFDLIVCSEVLYFLGTVENLRHVLAKIARALKPGGCFVTAHAHVVADEPHRPGFDWDLPFGAKKISDVLAGLSQLRLVRDLRTPMYRVQVYERQSPWRHWLPQRAAERTLLPQPTELPPHAASHAQWRGGVPQRLQGPPKIKTERLPILMYHHVSPDSVGHLDRYRVTPRQFEEQLEFLADRGYRSVSLEEWRRASVARTPLPGRCVAITFDDGYRNFLEHAWPLLLRYGFTATMFVPTRDIGTSDRWENEPANGTPLLSWDQLRKLRNEGLEVGSHSHVHPMLTSLSPTEIAREALLSRTLIDEHLGTGVTSFAYPYGEYDRVVERVIGGCGYTFALTCEERPAELQDRLLALPRLEIRGDCTRGDFADLLPET